MQKRYLSDIELNGDDGGIIKFFHRDRRVYSLFNCVLTEAISYDNGALCFYPNDSTKETQAFRATEEDFEDFKSVVSKSKSFICCGEDHIFSLNNVVSFHQESDCLAIDCRNDGYFVKSKTKEEVKDFIMAMRDKWQKTYAEWDQNRDCAIDEDTLNR